MDNSTNLYICFYMEIDKPFSIRKKKCLGLTIYEQFSETVMEWSLASFN